MWPEDKMPKNKYISRPFRADRSFDLHGSASFKFSLHFLDIAYCLVPMLQRGNPTWYAFPRWSVGTIKREPLKV
ncbi:hypothetical protein BuS5_02080 [Desulfosarcina sp. BuS5]|nr:hypothetical protein BuS5_02080 [Desulfosarcina sp. BuS5]